MNRQPCSSTACTRYSLSLGCLPLLLGLACEHRSVGHAQLPTVCALCVCLAGPCPSQYMYVDLAASGLLWLCLISGDCATGWRHCVAPISTHVHACCQLTCCQVGGCCFPPSAATRCSLCTPCAGLRELCAVTRLACCKSTTHLGPSLHCNHSPSRVTCQCVFLCLGLTVCCSQVRCMCRCQVCVLC